MKEFVDRVRTRGEEVAKRVEVKFVVAREQGGLVDCGAQLYERDRDAHASVLGSAIALRLFLFVVPANVALVGLVNVFRLGSVLQDDLEASTTTGSISKSLGGQGWGQAWWLFLSGLILTLLAGRSLSKVLAASSGGAWNMTVRESKVRPIAILMLTGLLFAEIASATVFRGLRDVGGVPAAFGAWLISIVANSLTFFLLMFVMPRKVRDPGALLPGAVLFGVAYTTLQWFMQFYLPNKVARTSDTFGDLALTVATLGNFFFIGRIMATSFVVSAVVYERWGSLSQVFFDLPGLRSIARRSGPLRRFFSLDLDHAEVAASDEVDDDGFVAIAAGEPATDEPAADEPAAEEPAVHVPATEESSHDV